MLLPDVVAPKGAVGFERETALLATGVFGHSLGALAHCVFGQFTGKKQTDSGLDLARGDGRFLVVVSKAGRFTSDALEDVIHERVHDAHGLAGDAGVWMHLLHNLVDVDGIAFLSPARSPLLVSSHLLGGGLLLTFLSYYFGGHRELSIASQTAKLHIEPTSTLFIAKFPGD